MLVASDICEGNLGGFISGVFMKGAIENRLNSPRPPLRHPIKRKRIKMLPPPQQLPVRHREFSFITYVLKPFPDAADLLGDDGLGVVLAEQEGLRSVETGGELAHARTGLRSKMPITGAPWARMIGSISRNSAW